MTYKSINLNSVVAPINGGTRLYALSHKDVFVLNDVAIKQTFNMTIKEIGLGEKIDDCFICVQKIKRKHRWQFWRPKYWGAKFMYVDKNKRIIVPKPRDIFRWQVLWGDDVNISDIILDVDEYENIKEKQNV